MAAENGQHGGQIGLGRTEILHIQYQRQVELAILRRALGQCGIQYGGIGIVQINGQCVGAGGFDFKSRFHTADTINFLNRCSLLYLHVPINFIYPSRPSERLSDGLRLFSAIMPTFFIDNPVFP